MMSTLIRKGLAGAALSLPFCLLACSTLPGTICDLECECEHCNDWEEEATCELREWERDVSDTYGCLEEWEAWAECVEDKGRCDEEAASFSTREPGSCTGVMQLGIPCTDNAQCDMGMGYPGVCVGGLCEVSACAPDNVQPCSSSAECPSGADRCATQEERVETCLEAASSVRLFLGGGGGVQPPEPQPQ